MASMICKQCSLKDGKDKKYNDKEFLICILCKKSCHIICSEVCKSNRLNELNLFQLSKIGFRWFCNDCITKDKFSVHNTVCEIKEQLNEMSKKIDKIENNTNERTTRMPNSETNESDSYASILRKSVESVVVVKPSEDVNMSVDELCNNVTSKLNPQSIRASGVFKSSKESKIVIKSNDKNSRTLCSAIQNDLGTNFNVTIASKLSPRIKIVRYRNNDDVDEDELRKLLCVQNANIINDESLIKNLKIIKNRHNEFSTIIIDCNFKVYNNLLLQKYVCLNWSRYKVYDGFEVVRCFKCSKLGHIEKNCFANKECCGNCAGNHKTNVCNNELMCCINCSEVNNKFHMKYNVDHASWDRKCPTMIRKLEQMKKNLLNTD